MGIFDFLKKNKEETQKGITSFLPQEIYNASALDLQDIIAPSALKITSQQVALGGKLSQTFFIISYPRFLTESWFSPIINLDKTFDVAIHVHPIDT